MASQFSLLWERRYGPFFLTQALGALNDNVLKNALVIVATYRTAEYTSLDPKVLAQLAGGLFILPFLLFSAMAGQFADKYDKAVLMRVVKVAEIAIMGIAAAGFLMKDMPLLLLSLFLSGAQSAFFGPAKYGMLPQVLGERELTNGNALLETGTFLAILMGTLLAGLFAALPGVDVLIAALLLFAVVGTVSSFFIPSLPPADPGLPIDWNPARTTWRIFRYAAGNATVFRALTGIAWFWALGAVILSVLPAYTRDILGGDESVVTLLLAVFSVGVGTGSMLCDRLSRHSIEIGLVPLGSIGLSLSLLWIWLATPAAPVPGMDWQAFAAGYWPVAAALAAIGLFGGLYIVPLYALIQSRSEKSHMSRVQAANNALNSLAMVVGAILAALAFHAGMGIITLLWVCAVANALVALYLYTRMPEFRERFVAWIFRSLLYPLRIAGEEHVPHEGPALLVCNPAGPAGLRVLGGAFWRPVRFVADAQDADRGILAALDEGHLVCLFVGDGPSTGEAGAASLVELLETLARRRVPVIPCGFDGPRAAGLAGIGRRVELRIGEPLAAGPMDPDRLSAGLSAGLSRVRGRRITPR